jgi:hypothetical protein
VLGERLAPRHFAGMGLIAGGLAVIDGRLLPGLLARKAGRRRDTGRGEPRRERGYRA